MDIVKGNFDDETDTHRGWIMGHFMEEDSPFKTENIEIKWGKHKAGEHKKSAAKNEKAKTLTILIKGRFTLTFYNQKIILYKEGDYCFWEAGTYHSWFADEDSLILTIRWPSLSGDQKSVVEL